MKEVNWFDQGLIPGILYFQNGGEYTGSVNDFSDKETREFRYKIETKQNIIEAAVWYGPQCYNTSDIVDQAEFSLDSDGRNDMLTWMKGKYESMIE